MKARNRDRLALSFVLLTVVLITVLLRADARGATYYLSLTGSDASAGSAVSTAWKTFAFALPKLQPGDTLILRDGTYTGSNSGYPNIVCGSNAANGTAAQPITLRAEHERRAFISSPGSTQVGVRIEGCAYWVVDGLHVRSADAPAASGGNPIYVLNSNHLTFHRLLVHHNNRYTNSHLLTLHNVNDSLVEESEFYFFHRHAVLMYGSSGNTIRRNYANSRGYGSIPGGYPSGRTDRGSSAYIIYPGSNQIVENNISEGNGDGFDIQGDYGNADNNRFFGDISLNDLYGGVFTARQSYTLSNTQLRDFVALNPTYTGPYFRSAAGSRCNQCTVIGGASSAGIVADQNPDFPGGGAYSTYLDNALVVGATGYGFNMRNQHAFALNYPGAWNNATNFQPSESAPNITNGKIQNPQLGSCKVFIPANSPMKGAAESGADIGANVLYRYQNGVLTTTPLWDPRTGAFPCGATVAGVNDIAGVSCFDVHKRLNVNANGCSLPAGYGQ